MPPRFYTSESVRVTVNAFRHLRSNALPVIIRASFSGFDVGGGGTMVVDMVFVLVLVDEVHTTDMEMVTIDRIIVSITDNDIIANVDILVSHVNIEGVVVMLPQTRRPSI